MRKLLLFVIGTLFPLVSIADISYNYDAEHKTAEVIGATAYNGNVVIPETVEYQNNIYTVTSIADHAFYERYYFYILLPKTIKTIGDYAFAHYYGERTIYLLSEEVVSCPSNAFKNSDIQNTTLCVPENLIASYQTADPWKDFGSIKAINKNETSLRMLDYAYYSLKQQMTAGYYVYGKQEYETDMGYPLYMIAATELLGDMYPQGSNSGYDWYRNYNTSEKNLGEDSKNAYVQWYTLANYIKVCNKVLGSVEIIDIDSDESYLGAVKGMHASIRSLRALFYYNLMVFYEAFENPYTDCSAVKGLTVPIVTESTDEETIHNNPRATHREMVDFILSDLDYAENAMKGWTPTDRGYLGLSVVYGLKTRVYMWDEQYAEAAKYARMAIDESMATPVNETQWEDPMTGFSQANQAWMWYLHCDANNMGNLCNFVGWMSGEADWGYSSLTRPSIDKSLYDKISDTDFRKHTFLDPAKYNYYEYKSVRDRQFIMDAPACLALKFRCLQGDFENYATGGASDVPVMRVEEMYLIEAEATAAAGNFTRGVELLNNFMRNYRDPNYSCKATNNLRDFQIEVLTQMRIEFWGEGVAFPSAKRLRVGVTQDYEGTNAPSDIFKINYEIIKPNWNFVFPKQAIEENVALVGMNNPDPSRVKQSPSPDPETPPEHTGDANGDNTVNAADIVEIVNAIMGNPSEKYNEASADINGDGVVNAADIVAIVNLIMKGDEEETSEWSDWQKWNSAGTATYTYVNFWGGDDPGLPFVYRQNLNSPNLYQFKLSKWGYGVEIVFDYDENTGHVTCAKQSTGYNHNTYGLVYAEDMNAYLAEYKGQDPVEEGYGTFDKEEYIITIPLAYVVDAGTFGYDPEYIYIDGYYRYDYSSSLIYSGIFIDVKEKVFAVGQLTAGVDVTTAKAVVVEASADADSIANAIAAGDMEAIDVQPGMIFVPIPEGLKNKLQIVSAVIVNGEVKSVASAPFSYYGGAASPWESIGIGYYTEDFIGSIYGWPPVTYEVEIEANTETPGLYRMLSPYGPAYPYYKENRFDHDAVYNIEVNAEDPEGVYIPLQPIGADWGYGMMSIQSWGDFYLTKYEFEKVKNAGLLGTLVDGVITFPSDPRQLDNGETAYSQGLIYLGESAYYAGSNQAVKLVLPSASEDVKAKARDAAKASNFARRLRGNDMDVHKVTKFIRALVPDK